MSVKPTKLTTNATFLRNRQGKPTKVRLAGKAAKRANGRAVPLATIRCKELDRYFTDRYGAVLPDDDAGREDVLIYLNHVAFRQVADRQWLMNDWMDRRAPWLLGDERAAFIRKVFRAPIRYSADTLAKKLGLTFARRQRLGIKTIGATDMPAEERKERRKAEDRERKAASRRSAGRMTREEYEEKSTSKLAPWKAKGISRATWFRRQKQQKAHYAADRLVSMIWHTVVTVRMI